MSRVVHRALDIAGIWLPKSSIYSVCKLKAGEIQGSNVAQTSVCDLSEPITD